jgi:hypothetical protein
MANYADIVSGKPGSLLATLYIPVLKDVAFRAIR